MMQTDAERLAFVVRFGKTDLDALRAGDWLNLREDCIAFLGIEVQGGMIGIQIPRDSGGIIVMPLNSPLPTEFAVEDFKVLQAHTQRILDEWVGPAPGEQGMLSPHDIRALYTVTRSRRAGTSWVSYLQVQGDTRELFLLVLFHLLSQASMDYVRRCPGCGTIFCRSAKQQRYCSRTCVNRANVRSWRERETVKQAEAERARNRYAEKQKPRRVTPKPRKRSTSHAETPRQP